MRPLVWFGPVFEPTGYADEGRGMITALDAAGIPVCLSANPVESPGFRQTLTDHQRGVLERSSTRAPVGEFVQVQHATIDCFNPAHARAVYSVGRSMFETDSLPSHWVSGANALDELWVPGAFNQETFRAAGVRVPIHIIPGGIDSEFFRPDVAPLHIAGLRGTVFLSVFEWRLRKGWDVLLRAWADAFTPDDDVTLVLRTHPIGAIDAARNTDNINGRIDAFLREQCGGRVRRDVAPIVILGDRIAGRDLPSLYTIAHAFVLPTRGEGWGRPFMESMSCGVPVIATRWSAHLAFMHDENSYLVDADTLVPADASEIPLYAGQRWAEPSTAHLTAQLRRVHSDRAEARALGASARRDMVEHWPWSRAANAIATRLTDINRQLDRRVVVPRTMPTGTTPTGKVQTVAICSLFRNSAAYVDSFRAMVTSQARPGIELVFSFVEGDSTDDTFARLQAWARDDARVLLSKRDVEPVTDFADRVTKWAALGNVAIDQALTTSCDRLLWCESDLVLPNDLLEQLVPEPCDIVAPAIFLGSMFYDTWGFRGVDGVRFSNHAPYHGEFRHHALVPLSSVGSCVLFRRTLFDRGVRFRGSYDDGLLVGVCRDATALGFATFMDSRVAILHPTSLWRKQQYRMNSVDVQCYRPTSMDLLADAARHIATNVQVLIGSVDLTGDHPVFAPVHAVMRAHLGATPWKVRIRLTSERDKQYALILSDTPEPRAAS